MKKYILILTAVLGVCALADQLVAPMREIVVPTNRHVNLNADSIRITVSEFTLDRQVLLNVEKRGTNDVIIDRELIRMTPAQLASWVNAGNPNAFLRTFILNRLNLTEKP